MYIKSALILSGVVVTTYTTFFASTTYWVSYFATTATCACPSEGAYKTSSAALTLCAPVTHCCHDCMHLRGCLQFNLQP